MTKELKLAGRHATDNAERSPQAWDHRADHAFLLRRAPVSTWADSTTFRCPLDAVVVPNSRGGDCPGIRFAINVAKALKAQVLVICSGEASVATFDWTQVPVAMQARVHVVDFGQVHEKWYAGEAVSAETPSGYDIANKRNLALTIAVVLGWRQILFLDDDMKPDRRSDGLNAANVAEVSRWVASGGAVAVGWSCVWYPDNSAVCHARRLAGLPQSTFIGAGALLVAVDLDVPFFPDEYNEDWFFLIALAARHENRFEALARAGSVRQLAFDPYTHERVARQEMGDILAEGLLNLLEDGSDLYDRDSPAMQPEFWRRAVKSRTWMVTMVGAMLRGISVARPSGRVRRRKAVLALKQAEQLARSLDSVRLAEWVRTQPVHLSRWSRHLSQLQGATEEIDVLVDEISSGRPPKSSGKDPSARTDALLLAHIDELAGLKQAKNTWQGWTKLPRKAQNRYSAITGGSRA